MDPEYQKCLFHHKPLLESGTLGTKGNTQVVVPRLTEHYGATRDPPEKSIPVCTLKNFPNKIEHTLQWARDWFEGAFKQSVDDVNMFLAQGNAGFEKALDAQPNTKLEVAARVKTALVDARPTTYEDCVVWARLQFEDCFHNSIAQLLHNFPEDQVTAGGTPFWSGAKRAPATCAFDANDALHLDYVKAAAALLNRRLRGWVRAHRYRKMKGASIRIQAAYKGYAVRLMIGPLLADAAGNREAIHQLLEESEAKKGDPAEKAAGQLLQAAKAEELEFQEVDDILLDVGDLNLEDFADGVVSSWDEVPDVVAEWTASATEDLSPAVFAEQLVKAAGGGEFWPRFLEEGIQDVATLKLLTEEDLKELGLPLGCRRRLLAALN